MIKYLIILIFLIPLIYNYWLLIWVFIITCFLFVSFNYLYDFVTPFRVLLGIDLLSYSLIGLSYFIVFLIIIASYKIYLSKDKLLEFSFVILVIIISLLLTFSSVNIFIFYLSFEISLIPTLFLIFGWGYQPERISAGYYLLFYTLFASLPLLLCIFYINILVYSLDFWFVCLDTNSFNFYIYLSLILAFLFKLPVPFFHF